MKKLLKICLWSLAFLVTLTVLFYAEENWRGARAWNKTLAELKAKGYPTTIAETIPPSIPDEDNIAAAPIFAELFDAHDNGNPDARLRKVKLIYTTKKGSLPFFQKGEIGDLQLFIDRPNATLTTKQAAQDLLSQFDQEWTPLLAKTTEALKRKGCRWPVAYEKGFEVDLGSYLNPCLNLTKSLELRALCYLETGENNKAVDDIISVYRLSQAVESNPKLIDSLLAITQRTIILNAFWSGLIKNQWNESDLLQLQQTFSVTNESEKFKQALLNEQAVVLSLNLKEVLKATNYVYGKNPVYWLINLQPYGWILSDKCFYASTLQTYLDDIKIGENLVLVKNLQHKNSIEFWPPPISFAHPLTKMALPSLQQTLNSLAKAEVANNQAVLACALERYKIHHGKLPESLSQLAPEYLDKIPNQVVVSEPMIYKRVDDQDYILYSIGWNMKDDGGVISGDKRQTANGYSTVRPDELDWVWASKPELYRIVQPQ